jgi:hypothetical protein
MTEENKTPETNEFGWEEISLFEEPKLEVEEKKDDEKEEKEEKEDFDFETVVSDKTVGKESGEQQLELNSIGIVSKLKEKGFIDFELEEGEELTEDLAEEILEEGFEVKLNEKIDELFKDLPDNVRELNKFVLKGGSLEKFIETMIKPVETGLRLDMDLDVEDNQIAITKFQLKQDGYDDDYIADQIEYLKDSGKLEKIAKTHFNKWAAKEKERQAELVERQKQAIAQEKQTRKAYKEKVAGLIKDVTDFEGLTITSQDKLVIPSYMTEKTVKLENGIEITEMQRDLHMALQDEKKAILIAKLLKNDFNFNDIVKNIETKITKKVKDTIEKGKQIPSTKGRGSSQPRSLADFL